MRIAWAACAAALAACAHALPAPPAAPAPAAGEAEAREAVAARAAEAQALLERVRAAQALPLTVSGEAKAFVDAPQDGGRYPLLFAVRRPASLRIDALTPVGEPAAALVAHQGRFALWDTRAGVFFRGRSTPRNLARLLPAPLADFELAALLCGAAPELPGAQPMEVRREGDDLRLVTSSLPPGVTTLRGERQEVLLGPDLRLLEVRRVLAGGPRDAEVLWAARLDDHDGASGRPLPRLLHLSVPAERIEIDLKIKGLLVGKPPPARAFALEPPPGVRVEELE